MTYPSAISAYSNKTDNVDDVMAADVNNLQTDIVNIETELGTDPAGTATDLKTRLSLALSGAGLLQFKAATTLTIATGIVTATQNYHRIDTEAAAASDDLDTITAGSEAQLLILRTVSGARNVTIRTGVGNIYCVNGKNILLENSTDLVILIYDATLHAWLALGSNAVMQTIAAWTPTFVGLTVVGTPTYTARYTKTGNILHFTIMVEATTTTASIAGSTYCDNLPFIPADYYTCQAMDDNVNFLGNGYVSQSLPRCYFPDWTARLATVTISGWYQIAP